MQRYTIPHYGRASQIIASIPKERTTRCSRLAHSLFVPHTPHNLSRPFRALPAGKDGLVWMGGLADIRLPLYLRLLWPKRCRYDWNRQHCTS